MATLKIEANPTSPIAKAAMFVIDHLSDDHREQVQTICDAFGRALASRNAIKESNKFYDSGITATYPVMFPVPDRWRWNMISTSNMKRWEDNYLVYIHMQMAKLVQAYVFADYERDGLHPTTEYVTDLFKVPGIQDRICNAIPTLKEAAPGRTASARTRAYNDWVSDTKVDIFAKIVDKFEYVAGNLLIDSPKFYTTYGFLVDLAELVLYMSPMTSRNLIDQRTIQDMALSRVPATRFRFFKYLMLILNKLADMNNLWDLSDNWAPWFTGFVAEHIPGGFATLYAYHVLHFGDVCPNCLYTMAVSKSDGYLKWGVRSLIHIIQDAEARNIRFVKDQPC